MNKQWWPWIVDLLLLVAVTALVIWIMRAG